MKNDPKGCAGVDAVDSSSARRNHVALIRKLMWFTGILVLWAIMIFGVQRMFVPERHSATARIEILPSHDFFDPRVWFQDKFRPAATSTVQEHVEAFKSHDLASAVVASLPPERFRELKIAVLTKPAGGRGVAAMAETFGVARDHRVEAALYEPSDYICDRLTVSPVSGCNMLDISIQGPSRVLAIQLLKEYLRAFTARNLEKRCMQTIASADNLEEGVVETLRHLKEAEASMLDFVVENGFSATENSGLGMVFKLINSHVGATPRHATVKVDNATPLRDLREKMSLDLGKLEAEQSGLSSTLGANHPRMMALNGKIDFLRDRIEYFRRNASLDNGSAINTPSDTHNSADKSGSSLNSAKSLEEKYSELKRDLDAKTDFHNLVRKESHQWNIRKRIIANNIVVIDGPRATTKDWWGW